MFSLIIAIVAIALVVALVIASSYFGGSAVSEAQATAEATRLRNEEQQILAAVDIFEADNRRFPNDIQELVSAGYLRTAPAGATLAQFEAQSFISSAYAAMTSGWHTVSSRAPVFITAANVNSAVCAQFNKLSRGDDGILKQPYASLGGQCFGVEGSYNVVIYKGGFNLASVLGSVQSGGLPAADAAGPWDKAPGAPAVAGSGSGGASAPDSGASAPEAPKEAKLALNSGGATSDFGTVNVGQSILSTPHTLSNSGNAAVTGLTVTVPDGFTLNSNSCGSSLAAGASCSFSVGFAPSMSGSFAGDVQVSSGNAGSQAYAVRGLARGVTTLSANWTSRDVGDILAGDLLAGFTPVNVLVTNTGSVDAVNLAVTTTSGIPVTWLAGTVNTCPALLPAGQTCRFRASSTYVVKEGLNTLTSTLQADNSNVLTSIQASNGVVESRPILAAWGDIRTAGNYNYIELIREKGAASAEASVMWINQGNTAMTLTSPQLPAPLSVSANNCVNIAPNGTCTMTLKMATETVTGTEISTHTYTPSGQKVKATTSLTISYAVIAPMN